jgi:hypothetical protein
MCDQHDGLILRQLHFRAFGLYCLFVGWRLAIEPYSHRKTDSHHYGCWDVFLFRLAFSKDKIVRITKDTARSANCVTI